MRWGLGGREGEVRTEDVLDGLRVPRKNSDGVEGIGICDYTPPGNHSV